MIDYGFFYDIAEYGNEAWKGGFTPKEIACNAYDYLTEFDYSKAKGNYHVSSTIQELLYMLDEDDSRICNCWASEIRYELGLNRPSVYTNNNKVYTKDGMCRMLDGLPKRATITIELK